MLYKEASKILQNVLDKKGSVKNLVLTSKFTNKKQLMALVSETLKYKSVLTTILTNTRLQRHEKLLRQDALALVLLYDLLLGKGLHGPTDKFKEAVLRHKAALCAELARIKVRENATSNKDLLPSKFKEKVKVPRYVRVNTLKASVDDVLEHFRRDEFRLVSAGKDHTSHQSVLSSLAEDQFVQDPDIPELLAFAPKTDFHDHILYTNGSIIFQAKSSCIPAHVLAPPPGSDVIDACAAPGNKTTHLAAIMGNKGNIFAFDRDVRRVATLNTMVLKAGSLSVVVKHGDFLETDPNDAKYRNVQYILVDPSCSGSGIVNRLNEATDDAESSSKSRLLQLALFQVRILTHAMTFPAVKRVVYSTCSVHQTENEAVVKQALEIMENNFKVVSVLEGHPNRGKPMEGFSKAHKCLRMDPITDLSDGFFVACLKRKNKSENMCLADIRAKNLSTPEWKKNETTGIDRSVQSSTNAQENGIGAKSAAAASVGNQQSKKPNQETKKLRKENANAEPLPKKKRRNNPVPSPKDKQKSVPSSEDKQKSVSLQLVSNNQLKRDKKQKRKQKKHHRAVTG